jgi:hypothetical protein
MAERDLLGFLGTPFIPRWLVTTTSRFGVDKVVKHFAKCGLHPRDAEGHLKHLVCHYLALVPPPKEPNWANISPPLALVSRLKIKQRVKIRAQEAKAAGTQLDLGAVQIALSPTGGLPVGNLLLQQASSSTHVEQIKQSDAVSLGSDSPSVQQ